MPEKKNTSSKDVRDPKDNAGAPVIPEYLSSVYGKRYFHPFAAEMLGSETAAWIKSFFCHKKLVKCVTDEIFPGKDVLQLGIASGRLEQEIVQHMKGKGHYCIEDVSIEQIDAMKARVREWLDIIIKERDFTILDERRYDTVVLYFVLHELPDKRKRAVLKRAFDTLNPAGKVIIVDYAQPDKYHPLKYPLRTFNRLFEPFAESLWYNEIQSFAPKIQNTEWERKTLFGGMYQCVTARRR